MNDPVISRTRQTRRAFTLIELLVVVAIISILASIAVPNFLEAQIRTKVSRMKNDMRTITVGLESYAIDNNGKYPIRRAEVLDPNPNYNPGISDPNDPNYWEYLYQQAIPDKMTTRDPHYQATQLARLTTPIGYLTTLYPDLFNTRDRAPDNLLDYWDPLQTLMFINNAPRISQLGPNDEDRIKRMQDAGYLVVCVGPDGYIGLNNRSLDRKYGWPATYSDRAPNSPYQVYDPSNGTVSIGNIFLGPQMGGLDGTGSNMTRRRPLHIMY